MIRPAAGVRKSGIDSETEEKLNAPKKRSNKRSVGQRQVSGMPIGEMTCASKRLRHLNDLLRTTLKGGKFEMTAGVRELPGDLRAQALSVLRSYDNFNPENDPFNEHEFGSFDIADRRFCWRIEAFDKHLRYGSDDPTDPKKTTRVLTLMLSSED